MCLTVIEAAIKERLQNRLPLFCEILNADAAGVHALRNGDTSAHLCLLTQQGLSEKEAEAAACLDGRQGWLGACIQQQKPQIHNTQEAPKGDALWAETHTFMAWPIWANGSLWGCVWSFSRKKPMASLAPQLMELFATQIACMQELEQLYQTAAREKQACEQLLARVPDALWIIQAAPETRFIWISERITDLTGYTPQEFMATPSIWDTWKEIIHPEDRELVWREFQHAQDGLLDEIHHLTRIFRKQGDMRWIHTQGKVVQEARGTYLYGICRDVTEHMRLLENIRRADRYLAVSMLAGGIAHQYNNFHFAALGTLELLLMRSDLDAEMRDSLQRVRQVLERATTVTKQLLMFAHGPSGSRQLLDVREIVQTTLSLLEAELMSHSIVIEQQHPADPLWVQGYRAELGQVLVNLVLNAQHAMLNRPVRRLSVQTGVDDKHNVFIRVVDTGQGISPEHLSRVFDPFFTTKGAAGTIISQRSAQEAGLMGYGLGLSVAQTIIQEHGGEIEVESVVDKGTCFTIRLPYCPK